MRNIIIWMLLLTGSSQASIAQELFVFTEPASNMPAKSIGIRVSNWLLQDQKSRALNDHLFPELMWGANKNLMLHAEGFFSNRNRKLTADGAAFYGKYRFYASDAVFTHFRMAAFGKLAINRSPIGQDEIDINGYNSGYQAGIIATKLLHKQALSSSIAFTKAFSNGDHNKFPLHQPDQAINVSLSTGRLILPFRYTGYDQTNVNVLLEVLGEHLINSSKLYFDIAPSLQFIFNSQTRVDIGYRKQLYSSMSRASPNGFVIRVEHLLFNVL